MRAYRVVLVNSHVSLAYYAVAPVTESGACDGWCFNPPTKRVVVSQSRWETVPH